MDENLPNSTTPAPLPGPNPIPQTLESVPSSTEPEPATNVTSPQPAQPTPLPVAKSPRSTPPLPVFIIFGVVILAVIGYLFFTGRGTAPAPTAPIQTTEPESELTEEPAETIGQAEVAQDEFSALVPVAPQSSGAISPEQTGGLTYSLPPGWSDNPAEGELTPQINFRRRLRSPDSCNTIVIATFNTGAMSFSDFLAGQYPGTSLTDLRHSSQFSVTGHEAFTVTSQGEGESFTHYISSNSMVHAVFAGYDIIKVDQDPNCSVNPPEVSTFMQSLALP